MDALPSLRQEIGALWADGKGKKLTAIALGWGLLNGTRMIYPVLLPLLSESFGLTLTTAGLLVTIIWVTYAIGQVPSGALADRYGERTILTAGWWSWLVECCWLFSLRRRGACSLQPD